MSPEKKNTGRKRTLTDEERRERKKEVNDRRISFSTPIGFKDIFNEFLAGRDAGIVLCAMINKNEEFKTFKSKKGAI